MLRMWGNCKLWFVAVCLLLILFSCEKQEGPGGTASIRGTITEQFFNEDFSRLVYSHPAVDEEVFIVYGDQEGLGDKIRTDNDGEFLFNYLFPGYYEVFFLSRDSTGQLDLDTEKVLSINLERGEDLDLGELYKLSTLAYDEGSATIMGKVTVKDYVDASSWPNLVIDRIYPAVEQEVYLSQGSGDFYNERIRTGIEGYFEFSNLIPGEYKVFLFSDDVSGESEKVALEYVVELSELDEIIDLGEIVIEKL